MIIKKVFQTSYRGQKSVTIPQSSKIKKGDYVGIILIDEETILKLDDLDLEISYKELKK